MSPSKPAAEATEAPAPLPAPAAPASLGSNGGARNGNGSEHQGNGNRSAARSARPKRTVLTAETADGAGSTVRGTSSQRGLSSTTIAKGTDEPEPAPPAPAPKAKDAKAARAAIPVPPVGRTAPAAPAAEPQTRAPLPVPTPPAPAPARRRLDTADLGFVGPSPGDQPFGPTRTSISDHLVAPVPRVLGRRPRVRKVTRVVRHVDPWSVFKVALVFNLVLYAVGLTAGVLLWNVAYATGTIDNMERFFESFGWSEFEFNGGEIFHSAWIAGLFGVVGLTGAAVLAATLFNLITDLVGGIRMTVLEEEVVEKTAAPMRRFVVQRPTPVPDDGTGPRRPGPPTNLPARRDG